MEIGDIPLYMQELGTQARAAASQIASAPCEQKNRALLATVGQLTQRREELLKCNREDMENARRNRLDDHLIDRLQLTGERLDAMINGIAQVASLPDPVGTVEKMSTVAGGFQVGKMRVPLGVIGIIYESRPNVTAEAASLCLKAGNAVILRGGKEAIGSNRVIASCFRQGLDSCGLAADTTTLVQTTDRAAVGEMITMSESIDVIVPRGGRALIERISQNARVPVIKHLDGICHVYIDQSADHDKAQGIAFNAKTQRYGTCNTMETLLVHKEVAAALLPGLARLYKQEGVQLRGCNKTCALLADQEVTAATEQDWHTEYLAPVLAVRIVDSFEQAVDHINSCGSHHTDAIVTENYTLSRRFLREVDSSSVMVNASTRLADGYEYGLGAEIGISTDKIHARGPVGLEGLTSQKYVVLGDGHIRT